MDSVGPGLQVRWPRIYPKRGTQPQLILGFVTARFQSFPKLRICAATERNDLPSRAFLDCLGEQLTSLVEIVVAGVPTQEELLP